MSQDHHQYWIDNQISTNSLEGMTKEIVETNYYTSRRISWLRRRIDLGRPKDEVQTSWKVALDGRMGRKRQ